MGDVDLLRVQLAADGCGLHRLRGLYADALVTQCGQVEVVRGLAASVRQTDQFSAVGTGLAVVFGEVGMEGHAVVVPLG